MNEIMSRVLRAALVATWAVLLAACGGGGGDDPSATNSAPTASAGAAQSVLAGAVVSLDGRGSTDPENDPLGYTWVLTTRPAGSTAALDNPSIATPSFTADVAGTYVATLTVGDGALASAPGEVTVTALRADTLTIVADKAEPLSGTVQFSISGSTATAPVTWYVDLGQIGAGSSVSWDTTLATTTSHLVVARIEVSPGNTVDIRRAVDVSVAEVPDSNILLSIEVVDTDHSGSYRLPIINVDISASSPFGISSVSASFDGTPIGTLTSLNGCSYTCERWSGIIDVYQFTVDRAAAGSGDHTMLVTVTDGSGNIRQSSFGMPLFNAPKLEVTAPAEDAFVHGSLKLTGSTSTDKAGATVALTASLGEVQFLKTGGGPFSADFDLTGVAPGSYPLYVEATDSTGDISYERRNVIVTSSSALVYTPILPLGPGGSMLAVDGRSLAYSAADQGVRLRDTQAATEVALQGASTVSGAAHWQVADGRVYAEGQDSDCQVSSVCVYQWQADGTRTDLTVNPGPVGAHSSRRQPVAHDGYAVWVNDSFSVLDDHGYTIYNAVSGSYTQVLPPADDYGDREFDFAVVDGVVNLVYRGDTGGVDKIYRWTSDAKTSTRLSEPGQKSTNPQTDGVRVAWSQWPADSASGMTSLLTQPLAGGTSTLVSSTMKTFQLRDGVLAWTEFTASGQALKASTTSGTSTLSALSTSELYGTGGGFVIFGEANKVYSWNAATGSATLLLEGAPEQILVSGPLIYFRMSSSGPVYRLALN